MWRAQRKRARGEWTNNIDWCYWKHPLIELADKTMGIIGYGRIGTLGRNHRKGLRHEGDAYDSFVKAEDSVTLDELWQSPRHFPALPAFPETQGIINRIISQRKDGVIILNNSRGPLIVEQDLTDALNSGKVYAAGLDVVSTEPIKADNPLLAAKNCFITPHISWAPKESRQRLMDIAVETSNSSSRVIPSTSSTRKALLMRFMAAFPSESAAFSATRPPGT
jgi:glycerate dehydrogenase